jgi:hypothetical protein
MYRSSLVPHLGFADVRQVIRGNSVVMLEALERIGGDDRQRRD